MEVLFQITARRKLASFVRSLKTLFCADPVGGIVRVEQNGGFQISVPDRGMELPMRQNPPPHVGVGSHCHVQAQINKPVTSPVTSECVKRWQRPTLVTLAPPVRRIVTEWRRMWARVGVLFSAFERSPIFHARLPDFPCLFRFENRPKFSPVLLNVEMASTRIVGLWFWILHKRKTPAASDVKCAGESAIKDNGRNRFDCFTIFASTSRTISV